MKSYVEKLHEKYGWPLKIRARGYEAALIGLQPLVGGALPRSIGSRVEMVW